MSNFQKYLEWRKTPHGQEVFAAAAEIALQMARKGFSHYSIWMIANVIRYHRHLKHGPRADDYKVCNNHLAYLSRELMATYPELKGMFTTKPMKHGSFQMELMESC